MRQLLNVAAMTARNGALALSPAILAPSPQRDLSCVWGGAMVQRWCGVIFLGWLGAAGPGEAEQRGDQVVAFIDQRRGFGLVCCLRFSFFLYVLGLVSVG